jgi:protein tyrosine/serine phosphatase
VEVTTTSRWIDLDCAANVRDLGGLPAVDGRSVQPHRLIRSDSLQALTPADVRHLVDDLGVRAIADLRTGVEVDSEGPGPMTREAQVEIQHFSLFPDAGRTTDAVADDADDQGGDQGGGKPVVLPWQTRDRAAGRDGRRRGAAEIYLRYLADREDSVLGALRLIAHTDGATVVHCAAGKDRTGVVVALALAEAGVERAAIVDDYARSAERVQAALTRLAARHTYAADILNDVDWERHTPRAVTMERLLDAVDEQHGGVGAWLRSRGWTEDDAAALRTKLLD